MYLLDTNVVSELRRPRPNSGLVRWLEATEDRHLHLSAVMLAEIQAGIELTRDRDPAKAAEIEAWADLLAEAYSVLPMDAPIFRQWAKLMHKQSDTVYEDAMIVATADVHQFTVVTRNVRDFARFRVSVLNPFKL